MQQQILNLEAVRGEDDEDTALLRGMAIDAELYLRAQPWLIEIKEGVYADGIGGIIALFLFRVDIKKIGADQWIWILTGDIPSAYLEFSDFPTPYKALEGYVSALEDWIKATRSRTAPHKENPIKAPQDEETLLMLVTRAKTLKQEILPHMSTTETIH